MTMNERSTALGQGTYFENEIRKEEAIVSSYVQSPLEKTLS